MRSDFIVIMANILVRNLPEHTKKALRIRAAENGRSMSEEAHFMIEAGTAAQQRAKPPVKTNWVDEMLAGLRAIGDAEFDPLPREEAPPPPDFSGPELD